MSIKAFNGMGNVLEYSRKYNEDFMQAWPSLKNIHTLVFDFDGVFTNNKVYVDADGVEFVCCDRSDGLAFDMLRAMCRQQDIQLDCFILSTEKNPVVAKRAQKMKLPCFSGEFGKLRFLDSYFSQNRGMDSNPFAGLVYLGNDLNDLAVMERAGFSVAPSDAHQVVKSVASMILPQEGGNGFVRAFVEKLLGVDKLTIGEINGFIFNS